MLRELITDRWILGMISFLILFSISCFLWYQYDIAPYRQQSDETTRLVRQMDVSQGTQNIVDSSTKGGTEETTPIAEKSTTITNDSVTKQTELGIPQTDISEIKHVSTDTQPVEQDDETLVSPFGYGPYPEVPEGFPTNIRIPWKLPSNQRSYEVRRKIELIARVLIKLWNEGDTSFTGGRITEDLKVYPHYPNTAYVKYSEDKLEDGRIVKSGSYSGGSDLSNITDIIRISGNTQGVRTIPEEEGGIDALNFLNLK